MIRAILKFVVSLFLYWLSGTLLLTLFLHAGQMFENEAALLGGGSFFLGLMLFSFRCFRMEPLYVFGHEMTHYLFAKLFRLKTGRIHIGLRDGYVEIVNANIWTTLAPYFILFYLIISMCILGLTQLFWYPTPMMGIYIFSAAMGLTYAYHCVMTIVAISHTQSDITKYGSLFSISLILICNAFFLLLAMMLVTRQWKATWYTFSDLALLQFHWLVNTFQHHLKHS